MFHVVSDNFFMPLASPNKKIYWVTMEESFTGGWYPDLCKFANVKMNREDYIADQDAAASPCTI